MDRYEKILRILRKENKTKSKDGVSGCILIICVLVALFIFVTCRNMIDDTGFEQNFSFIHSILEENIIGDTLYTSDNPPLLSIYNKASKIKTYDSKGMFFSMLYYEKTQDPYFLYADLQKNLITKEFPIEKDASYNGFSFRFNDDTVAFVSAYENYLFICFCDSERADSVKEVFCEISEEDEISKIAREQMVLKRYFVRYLREMKYLKKMR